MAWTGKLKLWIILSTFSAAYLIKLLYSRWRFFAKTGQIISFTNKYPISLKMISQANKIKYFFIIYFPSFSLSRAFRH